MSARELLETSVGSTWYSTCPRSGGLPAFAAVSSLVSSGSPPAWVCTCTWMSGWALFQIATTLSMLGTQVQKVSVTFWPEDAGADADEPAAGGGEDELP